MRLGVVAVASLAISLAFIFESPANAQIQTVPRESGAPPIAAPTGDGATGAPLAAPVGAPVGDVQADFVGPQSELEDTFTPLGLFMRADLVVKTVMILLILASFWSWVVIVDKWFSLGNLKRRSRRVEKIFWSGRSIDELYSKYSDRTDQPMVAVFVAALREWKRSYEKGAKLSGIISRVELAMNVSIQRESDKLERGLNYLATVGATAPFLGLFGTVWGIMNSFQAIAARQDTTLAVVAPGIAEALFATALGLLAAIPAVVAYNRFQGEVTRFIGQLESFADELSAFLSRQVDESIR
nr:MAG: protein TolQ [Hyphomicrobiales bacterium]